MAVTKNRIIEQAQKFTAKGQLEKAIAEYRKLLDIEPNDVRTWLKIGDLYTRMGSRKEATDTYLKVAEQYTRTGFHLKAVAVYKQILKLDPTLFEVNRLLAEAYSSLGLTSEALLHLEQLADTHQRMNRPQQMLGVLEMMANVDPHNIATRLRIAEYLSKEGRTQEAVMHFREVCEELRNQKRTNDFLKVAERLLFHDSSQVGVAKEAAASYLERGQFKSALTKLQMCFVKEPQNLRTLEMLAEAFRGLMQPDKAVSVYKEMALLLREQGKEARRQQVLEMILELDPNNKMALEALGRKSVSLSSKRTASSLRHAVSTASSDGESELSESAIPQEEGFTEEEIETQSRKLITESEVLLKYGLKERAVEHLQKALNFDPYNVDVRERLKDIHLDLGNIEHALEQLFFLSDMYRESQPEGSVYYLHEALRINPSNAKARKMIADLGGVMPEELDGGGTEETTADVGDELEADIGISPFFEDEEDLLLDDSTESEQSLIIEDNEKTTILGIDEPMWPKASSRSTAEPTIDDIPYRPPENTITEDDLLGGDQGLEMETTSYEIEPQVGSSAAAPRDEGGFEFDMDSLFSEESHSARSGQLSEAPRKEDRSEQRLSPAVLFSEPSKAAVIKNAKLPEIKEAKLAEITEELEEVDFFLSQELFNEARATLNDLLETYPNDPRLIELSKMIEEGIDKATIPIIVEEDDDEPRGSFFDYDRLAGEIVIEDISEEELGLGDEEKGVVSSRVELKQKVLETDFATHYDLGIAYKEMGFFNEAIIEFEISVKDPAKEALSKTMIGICYVGLDRTDKAIEIFKEGLGSKGASRQQKLAILYEMGKAYEKVGQIKRALGCYNKIREKDPKFADVASRIEELSSRRDPSPKTGGSF